ncbi:TniB family NTP-binding protein [Bordetella bronchiseptica]|uniref:TniB family NTP-binding protein n=1 Tax=Bordetella bronchiseptica TaxID=518 RepID=UPI000460B7E8|nr:TniB family NTP-binding protein [Bordetella bronchiseptica]KDC57246.1 AAA domain protein [Bordetella bronchiseptica MBORD591]
MSVLNSPLTSAAKTAESLLSLHIMHTRIAQVMAELNTLIYPGSQDSLMLVCGPTGVGKSTLARHLVREANKTMSVQMEADAGLIPAVYVEAPASGESDFSWRLFFSRILAQLEGGVSAPKTAYGVDPETGRMVRPRMLSNDTLAGLRTGVERALKARGTRFVVIDEAAHIIRQSRSKRLEIQLDTLKSLANACGVQLVLAGSYDLYRLMSLSGQLARRSHVLHFERYREDHDTDLRAFRACVQKFQNELPHLWGERLLSYSSALHENTLGCVGTLSAVLTRAAKMAEQAGSFSEDALRRALLTEAQRKQILEEILEGEAAINPCLTRTMPKLPHVAGQRARSAA